MPIDIATGAVRLEFDDIVIPGHIDLVWTRIYSTRLLDRAVTPLGRGWISPYYTTLTRTADGYDLITPEGDVEQFFDPDDLVDHGGRVRRLATFEEIFRQGNRYIVQRWDPEDGKVVRYCFACGTPDRASALVAVEDVTGRGLDLAWDHHGRLAGVRQRLEQRVLIIGYSASGRIEQLVFKGANNERHVLVRYEHDAAGQLIAAHDAADFADRYEYRGDGRLSCEMVRDGGVFTYRYDDQGRCIYTSGLDRYGEKRLRFFQAINFTEVTDSYDATFRYHYLPSGQIVQQIDPLGGERRTEYDEHGRILAKIDSLGGATRYQYDAVGNLASVTDAAGNVSLLEYTADHVPTAFTDPLGRRWSRIYDEAHRLVATCDPLGHRWSLEYDREDNLTAVTNAVGATKNIKYRNGVVESSTDWLGNVTNFEVDAFGRVARIVQPQGRTFAFTYDLLGNPIAVSLPDGSKRQARFDAASNMIAYVDGNGSVTEFRYGPCERLLERIDPTGAKVRYAWGTEPERLLSIENECGEVHSYDRNELGMLVRETTFAGAVRRFAYNAEGFVVEYTNANDETILIERDALQRIVGQSLPDGEQLRFEMDPAGRMIAAVSRDVGIRFERDEIGRIVREVQGEYWVASHYDAVGHLLHVESSVGHTLDFRNDANGRIYSLTLDADQSLKFRRNEFGQEVWRALNGTAITEQRYDQMGRLVEQQVTPGTDAGASPTRRHGLQRRYSYDGGGNLVATADTLWGSTGYVYDPAARLLKAVRDSGFAEIFEYDATSNIVRIQTQSHDSVTDEALKYSPGDRLVQQGATLYEYDAEGRRTCKVEHARTDPQIWRYQWSATDRLRSIVQPDGSVWSYQYDALGRRVLKSGGGKQRAFIWYQGVLLHEVEGGREVVTWIFDHEGYAPLATLQQGELYSVLNDPIGTPRELIDDTGSIVWSVVRRAWGRELEGRHAVGAQHIEQNLRFPGQYFDAESGLHYNRHRYYDPQSGRYLCDDPIGVLGGLNGYQYAPNPFGYLDPFGLTGNPADATHITYEGVKNGKPYIGYASKPGLGHSAADVLAYRYPNTDHFDVPPKPFFVGDGQEGKNIARGLEQRVFEDRGGLAGTSNLQNPVGENNLNRDTYLAAADKHRAEEAAKKKQEQKGKKRKKEC